MDSRRIAGWVARFAGYRWNVTPARIQTWLQQFHTADQDMAARVLDAVQFVTHQAMEDAFRLMLSRLSRWDKAKSRRIGKWRFVAFSRAAGESGDTMLHKWRSATRLGPSRYDDLFINKRDLVREELGPNDTVVFLDDFAGTGRQVCKGWSEVMAELLPGEPRIYLVLVVLGRDARQRISSETPLRVISSVKLKEGDNIFSTRCTHFTRPEKDTLLQYCRRANRRDPKGYGDCGLVIVLAHKTPNNSIPVLHTEHDNWTALFPR